ncbi:Cys-tRNA(Pro) deacylase [Marinobacter sp.]|uniref:Cys-tRNA(Pro) deacylase n=1 Tax=Marinobacter sp. TaxID=50741 RepID=UPI003561A8A2
MTPGILAAKKAKVSYTVHEYEHDPSAESYGNEAAEKMGVNPNQVFKTLVVAIDGKELAVAVVPVTAMLSLKLLAKAAGAKKAAMADKQEVQRSTGYVLGGVSPLGQKKRLKTFIDASAGQFDTVFVSAGKRGLEIELAPADLARLTGARFTSLQLSNSG